MDKKNFEKMNTEELEALVKQKRYERSLEELNMKNMEEELRTLRSQKLLPEQLQDIQEQYSRIQAELTAPTTGLTVAEIKMRTETVLDPLRRKAKKLMDDNNVPYLSDAGGLPITGFTPVATAVTETILPDHTENTTLPSPIIAAADPLLTQENTNVGQDQSKIVTEKNKPAKNKFGMIANMRRAGIANQAKHPPIAPQIQEAPLTTTLPVLAAEVVGAPIVSVAEPLAAEKKSIASAIEETKVAVESLYPNTKTTYVETKKIEEKKPTIPNTFSYTYTAPKTPEPTSTTYEEATIFTAPKEEPGFMEKARTNLKLMLGGFGSLYKKFKQAFSSSPKTEAPKKIASPVATQEIKTPAPYAPFPVDPRAPKAGTVPQTNSVVQNTVTPQTVPTIEPLKIDEPTLLKKDMDFLNRKIQNNEGIITVSESDLSSTYAKKRFHELKNVPVGSKNIVFNRAELRVIGDGVQNVIENKPLGDEAAVIAKAQERAPRFDANIILNAAVKPIDPKIIRLSESSVETPKKIENLATVEQIVTNMFDRAFESAHGIGRTYLHASESPEWRAISTTKAINVVGKYDAHIVGPHAKFFTQVSNLAKLFNLYPTREEALREYVPRLFKVAAEQDLRQRSRMAA